MRGGDSAGARFERVRELNADSPTLIEGLPGLGMVASIAVDQVTRQLDLSHHGSIVSADFPPVAAFTEGRVRDAVRVNAGPDPAVMTLQSDVPIPPTALDALRSCVLGDLAAEFDDAIFLAGAPAETEERIGEVVGVATTDTLERELADANVEVAGGPGVIGGVTGALLSGCYHEDVPAAVLIVRSNPYIPDPAAARAVIENALEPLVAFDIDTADLKEQAEEIQEQKRQIANQLQQLQRGEQQEPSMPGMYQ
jgi:uncharacterized protein